jgi:hypothetical protein
VILQGKGLPVSGKKTDLITRLVENKGSSSTKSAIDEEFVQVDDNTSPGNLPFLSSIIQNGISSVEFDKEQTIRYGITAFMFTMIVISLNSTSWYNLETSGTSTTPYLTDYSYELEIDFGLFDYESTRADGDANDNVRIETATTEHTYDGLLCEIDFESFDCEAFSTAGTINSLMLWLSLLAILTILGMGLTEGFGKLESGFIVENREQIDKMIRVLATVPIFIGTFVYGLMASSAQTATSIDEDATSGLGGMWWMMFLLSTAYICYIYRSIILKLYHKFMSDEPEASND